MQELRFKSTLLMNICNTKVLVAFHRVPEIQKLSIGFSLIPPSSSIRTIAVYPCGTDVDNH